MYYLQDLTRRLGVFNLNNNYGPFTPFTDADDAWTSYDQRAGVEAQYNLAKTFDYFRQVYQWNGMDGSGGSLTYYAADGVTRLITAGVRYRQNYNNAFWDPNGKVFRFGDGDGVRFSPLVSLDYVAHEWMHGITQFTANLIYANESGALSESLSDVFGAMVERWVDGENADVWKIGEDCYTPSIPGDASRYLNEPHLADGYGYTTDDQPDHYSERYLGAEDAGGVHVNSGIANKAFYLVAKGGSHHRGGTMTGIGADAAAAIWFRALRYYLTSSTDFLAAREATLQAAADLYPNNGNVYFAVAKAWGLCGVGDIPTLIVSPVKLRLPLVAGCANTWQRELSITSASGSPTTWTATDNAAWLTLNRTSGTTPMSLTVTVNTAGLPFQSHSATITLTANGKAVRVPVSLFPSRMACQAPAS
jgi:Zn-dependent metalloprotease